MTLSRRRDTHLTTTPGREWRISDLPTCPGNSFDIKRPPLYLVSTSHSRGNCTSGVVRNTGPTTRHVASESGFGPEMGDHLRPSWRRTTLLAFTEIYKGIQGTPHFSVSVTTPPYTPSLYLVLEGGVGRKGILQHPTPLRSH